MRQAYMIDSTICFQDNVSSSSGGNATSELSSTRTLLFSDVASLDASSVATTVSASFLPPFILSDLSSEIPSEVLLLLLFSVLSFSEESSSSFESVFSDEESGRSVEPLLVSTFSDGSLSAVSLSTGTSTVFFYFYQLVYNLCRTVPVLTQCHVISVCAAFENDVLESLTVSESILADFSDFPWDAY